MATESVHQDDVAFADAATVRRLRAANAECLLGSRRRRSVAAAPEPM
ncbi:hypothetical protein [Capillimicrobium parvum]|nr:hypothetical protein [Capillimicrobium parvum]